MKSPFLFLVEVKPNKKYSQAQEGFTETVSEECNKEIIMFK